MKSSVKTFFSVLLFSLVLIFSSCENFVWHGNLLMDFERNTVVRIAFYSDETADAKVFYKAYRIGHVISKDALPLYTDKDVASWNMTTKPGAWKPKAGSPVENLVLDASGNVTAVKVLSNDIELVVSKWVYPYLLGISTEKTDGTYDVKTVVKYGVKGTVTTEAAEEKPGFTSTVTQTTITSPSLSTATIVYERKTIYIHLIDPIGTPWTPFGKFGTQVTYVMPVHAGYTIAGYIDKNGKTVTELPEFFPAEDEEYTIVWSYK